MKPEEQKAEELINEFKAYLMQYNSDISEEINISLIAMEHAKITVKNIYQNCKLSDINYWSKVLKEIEKY